MKTLAHAVLACLCLAGTATYAQTSEAVLRPDVRARITAPNVRVDPVVGRIISRDSASLSMRPDRSQSTIVIGWPDIQRAEVSRGRRRGALAAPERWGPVAIPPGA